MSERKIHPINEKELQALLDEQIREWFNGADFPLQPDEPGLSGPLSGDVFLPPDVVDEMEAAINEAFEQVNDQEDIYDESTQ